MALNVDLRELTQPGATGNQTISLAANFDPKVIILWTSAGTVAGTEATLQFGMGYGTYRGSVVQQRYACVNSIDAQTSGNTERLQNSDALLVLIIANIGTGTRDLEIDLVSMQGGATSQVVINWVNLFTTASIKINCLIIGGDAVSDALAFNFTLTQAVSFQDVTVASGFGQPDFLVLLTTGSSGLISEGDSSINMGFGKKGQTGRHTTYGSLDGNTTMFVAMSQRSDHIVRVVEPGNPAADTASFALDTVIGNWPVDGFRIVYTTQPVTAGMVCLGLALKGTFTSATGSGAAPISGTPPVVQNLSHGSPPKLGWVQGWNLAANTTIVEAGTDLGAFFVGAGDGTIELVSGGTDDDALGTSDCNKFWSNAKVAQNYNNVAALQSEADGLISGNNFQLSWNDIDTVEREYQWFTLGDAPAAPAGGLKNSLLLLGVGI